MPEPLHLPELARSLRALGTARGVAAESAHAAVFGPLLDARAHAATGGLGDALSVFRGQALAARIVARAADAARADQADVARARARVALAREALEPLRDALHALDALASVIPADLSAARSPAADAWMAQLACVFRTADEACRTLTQVLAKRESVEVRRGWLPRLRR